MAAPVKEDPGADKSLDLTAMLLRERYRLATVAWQRGREAFHSRRISWEELVFGGRRKSEGGGK